MTNGRGIGFRILADAFVACLVPLAFMAASRNNNDPLLRIGALAAQLLAVGVMAYLEPSAKKVWIHPLVIMLPELIVLPASVLSCRGHGCVGMFVFLILVYLCTLLLMGLSFGIFYVKRRIVRSGRE